MSSSPHPAGEDRYSSVMLRAPQTHRGHLDGILLPLTRCHVFSGRAGGSPGSSSSWPLPRPSPGPTNHVCWTRLLCRLRCACPLPICSRVHTAGCPKPCDPSRTARRPLSLLMHFEVKAAFPVTHLSARLIGGDSTSLGWLGEAVLVPVSCTENLRVGPSASPPFPVQSPAGV